MKEFAFDRIWSDLVLQHEKICSHALGLAKINRIYDAAVAESRKSQACFQII